MNFKLKAIVLGLLVSSQAFTFENERGHGGNGGGSCEQRILTIRDDIKNWIHNNGDQNLELGSKLSHADYKSKMLGAIDIAEVSCVDSTIRVNGVEKTCKNRGSKITCNFTRFSKRTKQAEQYRLIHHEYAGIAKIETNNGSPESNYNISNQITAYLEPETILRLNVKPYKRFNNYIGHTKRGAKIIFNFPSLLIYKYEGTDAIAKTTGMAEALFEIFKSSSWMLTKDVYDTSTERDIRLIDESGKCIVEGNASEIFEKMGRVIERLKIANGRTVYIGNRSFTKNFIDYPPVNIKNINNKCVINIDFSRISEDGWKQYPPQYFSTVFINRSQYEGDLSPLDFGLDQRYDFENYEYYIEGRFQFLR